jgi:hypothetical protein
MPSFVPVVKISGTNKKIGPETNASSDNYFSTLARLCTPAARVRILFGRDISQKKILSPVFRVLGFSRLGVGYLDSIAFGHSWIADIHIVLIQ